MNDDLNRALAEAMGERVRGNPPELLFWHGQGEQLPDFATSLDALRDGPERVLRECGAWEIAASWFRTSEGVEVFEAVVHVYGFSVAFAGRGATEAEARARAALAALTDQRKQTTGLTSSLTSSLREPLVRDVLPAPDAPRTDGGAG